MKAIIIIAIISGAKLLPIHLIITIITISAESFARQSLPTSGQTFTIPQFEEETHTIII